VGADAFRYEIRLRTAPVYRVRGVVRSSQGEPVPGASVRLLPARGGRSPGSGSLTLGNASFLIPGIDGGMPEGPAAVTNERGEFDFAAVRAGEWRASAQISTRDVANHRDNMLAGGVSLIVPGRSADDLQITVGPPFSLDVMTDWGDAPIPPQRGPRAILIGDGQPFTGRISQDGGRFEDVFPGRYRIVPMPSPLPGYYPASVLLAGREALGEIVDLDAGLGPVRILYKPGAGTIRATLPQEEPATLLVLPENIEQAQVVPIAHVTAGGAAEVRNVPPGNYLVVAFDRVEPATLFEPGFLRGLLPLAARVKLEEGASVSAELRVSRWPQ
jgi:hypothetical protein